MDERTTRITDRLVNLNAQPILLCLRGGGADEKRKAARKRKFASMQGDELIMKAIECQSLQKSDVQAEPISRKQRTQTSSPAQDADPQANPKVDSEDGEEAKDVNGQNESVQQKSRRFIVFIGMMRFRILYL